VLHPPSLLVKTVKTHLLPNTGIPKRSTTSKVRELLFTPRYLMELLYSRSKKQFANAVKFAVILREMLCEVA
jgi:hypothetical protein